MAETLKGPIQFKTNNGCSNIGNVQMERLPIFHFYSITASTTTLEGLLTSSNSLSHSSIVVCYSPQVSVPRRLLTILATFVLFINFDDTLSLCHFN